MLPTDSRTTRGLLCALLLMSMACAGSAGTEGTPAAAVEATPAAAPMADSRADEPSTLDGIYTEEQAERGRQVCLKSCDACHSESDWQDRGFKARWEGESVYRFWYWIYETMPDDEPPYAMPRPEVSDVLTYILQLNGLPTGESELGSTDDEIDIHWLRWTAGGN